MLLSHLDRFLFCFASPSSHQTQHNVILGLQRGKLLAVFTPTDARGRKTRA